MAESITTKDDFHRERSHFLDAFASLEELLLRLPKASHDKLLAEELKDLRAIRNDLVHSQSRFVQVDGQLNALFVNALFHDNAARQARLVKFSDFETLSVRIQKTRSGLGQAA